MKLWKIAQSKILKLNTSKEKHHNNLIKRGETINKKIEENLKKLEKNKNLLKKEIKSIDVLESKLNEISLERDKKSKLKKFYKEQKKIHNILFPNLNFIIEKKKTKNRKNIFWMKKFWKEIL